MDTLNKIFFTFAVIALVCYFLIKSMGKYKDTITHNVIVIAASVEHHQRFRGKLQAEIEDLKQAIQDY